MNMHFDELLGKITSFMKSEANTKTVVGEQFQLGEFYCIPVIRVGMGFGTGGGEGDDPKKMHGEGGGAGGGMGIEPIGFLVSKGEDIQFISTKTNKGLAAAFEKVPALIEKYMEMQEKKEEGVPA
jgi:uncharacterized spore protein YtfJ